MNNEEMIAFNLENMKGVGILDGGATKSVGSYVLIEELIEEWHECEEAPPTELEETSIGFTFAGGEEASAVTRAWLPSDLFSDGVGLNVVPTESTPMLLGLDFLRYYGLVIDYFNDTVFSHRLNQYVPSVVLCSGHIAVDLRPKPPLS